MLTDIESICDQVSKENNIDTDLLKSVNRTVFKEIKDWTKEPTSLKIYLNNIGSWYFKKEKTEDKLDLYQKLLVNTYNTFDNEEKAKLKIKNYTFILNQYKDYLKDKIEIKHKKYGKEAYEAYCLDKIQKKIQESKDNKSI